MNNNIEPIDTNDIDETHFVSLHRIKQLGSWFLLFVLGGAFFFWIVSKL